MDDITSRPGVVMLTAYPNPGNPTITIAYTLTKSMPVRLTLYDMRGRRVRILHSGEHSAGEHRVAVDVSSLASGRYVYRLDAPNAALHGILLVVK